MDQDPTRATTQDGWTIYGQPIRGRSCGACKFCCTAVPTDLRPLRAMKAAGVRCPLLCSRGCRVYSVRPDPCRYWSCRWLFDEGTAATGIRRPDISGYAIDPIPDEIFADGRAASVMQIWNDPKRRDAHRDPALRRFLETLNMAAIVRFGSDDGIVIAPPGLTKEGEWIEITGTEMISAEEKSAKLVAIGERGFLDSLAVSPPTVRFG